MSLKDWPALPSEDDWRHDFEDAVMRSDEALSIRLRDTAETLRQWIAWRDNAPDCECIVVTAHTAREILARLKEEGLTWQTNAPT